MNYDEIAALQRSLQARQSRKQHEEAQEKLADVEAQLRIANLPPTERETALRKHEKAKHDARMRSFRNEKEALDDSAKFIVGFVLCLLVVGAVVGGIISSAQNRHDAERAVTEKENERWKAKQEASRRDDVYARAAEIEGRALEQQREAERALEQQRFAARLVLVEKQQKAAAKQQAEQEATFQRLFTFRLKRAIEGEAVFQYDLALQYLNGQGVPQDVSAAKDWLKKAAAQGHKKAQAQLAELTATESPVAK